MQFPQVVPNNAQQGTGINTTPVYGPMDGFPYQSQKVNAPPGYCANGTPFSLSSPVILARSPMAISPQQHPIQQPFMATSHIPIPLLQSTPSVTSVSSAHSTRSDSVENTSVDGAAASTPGFPQTFQPIQLVRQPQMMMNYNGQLQPLIPVVPIQTANGVQYQPVYYHPEQMQGNAPIPMPTKHILTPEQHPVMTKQESKNRSLSLSDNRSISYSHDGSELSDSFDGKNHSLQQTPLRRTSSAASNDGYGSECGSTSRVGSDYYDSYSDVDDDKKHNVDVQSPDNKMFYTTSTKTYENINNECNSSTQTYIDRLSHTKGYQVFQNSPDRDRSSSSSKKRPTSKERQEELYKTELCNYWINGQKCRFGKRCIFAHGQHELRMPKRKLERNRLRAPFRKQIGSILNKLSESNFDTLSTELLCAAVEDVRNDEKLTMILARALFNKAVNDAQHQKLYAEVWRKLLNVHPMAQKMASQMSDLCVHEYSKPRSKNHGQNAMKWIVELCKKKTLHSQDTVHKVLGDMFVDSQKEENVELWCKLLELMKTTVDTAKYFQQLNKLKKSFSSRIRFMIMDLEDLKKRNWVKRQ